MLRLRAQRWYWSRRRTPPQILARQWVSALPLGEHTVEGLRFLVCDAEMSGLDPSNSELLSLGWVGVDGLEIELASARHLLLKPDRGVGQSATIHRLRDCELENGMTPAAALNELVVAARDRVLVFHHAALDMAFLNGLSRQAWGVPLLLPVVDTLRIEEQLVRRDRGVVASGELRLPACRARYGLAAHRGHSALTDAIATAELLLAQISRRGSGLRLRDLQ